MHIVDINHLLVVVDAKHVNVVKGLAHDHALGLVAGYKLIFLLKHLRFLKTQLSGKPHHVVFKIVEQLLGVATQNLLHIVDHGAILLLVDHPLAAPEAVLEMIFKA